jgi:hypothetical protein
MEDEKHGLSLNHWGFGVASAQLIEIELSVQERSTGWINRLDGLDSEGGEDTEEMSGPSY